MVRHNQTNEEGLKQRQAQLSPCRTTNQPGLRASRVCVRGAVAAANLLKKRTRCWRGAPGSCVLKVVKNATVPHRLPLWNGTFVRSRHKCMTAAARTHVAGSAAVSFMATAARRSRCNLPTNVCLRERATTANHVENAGFVTRVCAGKREKESGGGRAREVRKEQYQLNRQLNQTE